MLIRSDRSVEIAHHARAQRQRGAFIVAALMGALAGSSLVRSFAAGDCQGPTWQIHLVQTNEPMSDVWADQASLTIEYGNIDITASSRYAIDYISAAHP